MTSDPTNPDGYCSQCKTRMHVRCVRQHNRVLKISAANGDAVSDSEEEGDVANVDPDDAVESRSIEESDEPSRFVVSTQESNIVIDSSETRWDDGAFDTIRSEISTSSLRDHLSNETVETHRIRDTRGPYREVETTGPRSIVNTHATRLYVNNTSRLWNDGVVTTVRREQPTENSQVAHHNHSLVASRNIETMIVRHYDGDVDMHTRFHITVTCESDVECWHKESSVIDRHGETSTQYRWFGESEETLWIDSIVDSHLIRESSDVETTR